MTGGLGWQDGAGTMGLSFGLLLESAIVHILLCSYVPIVHLSVSTCFNILDSFHPCLSTLVGLHQTAFL